MNFYKRHIGDYMKDAGHLSLLEHGVYVRLMDVYYTRESGIPEAQSARLVGARTEEERAALQNVLDEFFVLEDCVWHQRRCDAEIQAAQESQAERDARRDNERERQSRHRDERRDLFAKLREHGVIPAYDTPTHELRTDLSRVTGGDGTRDVTCTDTAIHKPLAISHKPDKEQKTTRSPASTTLVSLADLIADGLAEQTAAEWLAYRKRKRSQLTPRAWDGLKAEIQKAGLTPEAGVCMAMARGWQGFNADWCAQSAPASRATAKSSNPSYDDGQRRDYGQGGKL
ncbi:YdaU family protein [Chitinolyticbacter meiyuanensis]|uniref:YdaU family protein n=1 Tax=Chitinolyticbacter meiyuanensis TaxID=682798 RepID=UPI0011E5E4F8|nr:YdaU family protein [Chitinolyticbacter meiyuanensis]